MSVVFHPDYSEIDLVLNSRTVLTSGGEGLDLILSADFALLLVTFTAGLVKLSLSARAYIHV